MSNTFGIKINCRGNLSLKNVSAVVPDNGTAVVIEKKERPLTHSIKIYCRKCRSDNTIENITGMTEMHELPHVDEQGYKHLHNNNYMSVNVTCQECGEKYYTKKYSVCWCGWSNNGQ